ncbi:hypothetical protein SAMN05216262_102290 [Colwellia chukchiensis]|uniref:Aminoglycoside phosphotransferase domain-containing protein n=1 Tax=Colwellia chukchiensis TaxID=641665 RepID=A0A1H7JMA7_9GAMM|nr:phosphotransferase [Colwellia chukchiensis]SEK75788.1 hypothetical protein SAMN05216262_102290 [Colwellia chukchiensis]
MKQKRTVELLDWLTAHFNAQNIHLTPLTGDAGFRRYFRFSIHGRSYIAVDAPVKLSNNQAFVSVQQSLQQANINVPAIIALDLTHGFMCLSDFGDDLLATTLNQKNMRHYYQLALTELNKMQGCPNAVLDALPLYDEAFIRTELALFSQWLLIEHLDIELTLAEQAQLEHCFSLLVSAIVEQPKVFMHRDYHSRNIMLLADDRLGIIDFQDAVKGPIIYDLVSLLRDCYLRWPNALIEPLLEDYRQRAQKLVPELSISKQQWQYWFDLTGLQRHIKASGIFARLHHRDNKPAYLADIPLTLRYIQDVSQQYPQLSFLYQLVTERVIPALASKQSHHD